MRESRGIVLPVGAGLAVALLACSSTYLHLSSIKIDDGLEGLVFLPILLGAGFLVGPVLGRRRTNPLQPFLCAAVASVAVGITLAAWRSTRQGGASTFSIVVMTVVVFFPLALTGAVLGWAAGIALRRLRFPTRI
jgi:hypothetical protein